MYIKNAQFVSADNFNVLRKGNIDYYSNILVMLSLKENIKESNCKV